MDHFSESELFDEDMPAASPLSVEQPTEALRPSATGGWSAIAAALARRWPACVAGLLVAMLAVGLLSRVSSTHHQISGALHHDRHRPRRRRASHQRSAGRLGRVWVPPPASRVSAGRGTASDIPPSPVAPRPTRVGRVGTDRPTSPVQVGKMGQTQFDYLGR